MAIYAEFFQVNLAGVIAPGCGSDSYIRLDGRNSRYNQEMLAEQECRRRKFVAWRLIRGESLLRAQPITKTTSLYY
jgi:hypothetical protein